MDRIFAMRNVQSNWGGGRLLRNYENNDAFKLNSHRHRQALITQPPTQSSQHESHNVMLYTLTNCSLQLFYWRMRWNWVCCPESPWPMSRKGPVSRSVSRGVSRRLSQVTHSELNTLTVRVRRTMTLCASGCCWLVCCIRCKIILSYSFGLPWGRVGIWMDKLDIPEKWNVQHNLQLQHYIRYTILCFILLVISKCCTYMF